MSSDSLPFEALCLDLDGTVVDPDGKIRESTRASIARLREAGVRVMITTGRSVLGTEAIVEELDLREPASVVTLPAHSTPCTTAGATIAAATTAAEAFAAFTCQRRLSADHRCRRPPHAKPN